MPNYIYAISPAIGIALSSIIVYYLYSLETLGCECSLTTKRSYILGFNSFLIVFNLFLLMIGGVEVMLALCHKYPVLYILYLALIGGSLANVVFTLEFIDDMKREKCACSDSVYRDIMYILALLQALSWFIMGLAFLVVGGLIAKDFATGRVTVKNIERVAKAMKAAKKS